MNNLKIKVDGTLSDELMDYFLNNMLLDLIRDMRNNYPHIKNIGIIIFGTPESGQLSLSHTVSTYEIGKSRTFYLHRELFIP